MNKCQQIEEIALDLNSLIYFKDNGLVARYATAKAMYDFGYRKQSEWISVEDRLPDCRLIRDIFNKPSEYISDVVLVCVKSNECDGVRYYVSTDMMRGRTSENIHWMMSCGYSGSAVYNQEIIYWMPLPTPPVN